MCAGVLWNDHNVPDAAKALEALTCGLNANPSALELTEHEELSDVVVGLRRGAPPVYDGETSKFAVHSNEKRTGLRVVKVGSEVIAFVLTGIGKLPARVPADILTHIVDVVAAHPLQGGKLFNRDLS